MLKVRTITEVNLLIREQWGGLRSKHETVDLEDALGRVLIEDILANAFVPDFDRSTVDGFAVRATDVFSCSDAIPALLILRGEASMGEHTNIQLKPGECLYVPTGAELPAGADTMVMLEYVDDLGDGTIAIYKAAAPGANMIFRGDDVKPGDMVLHAGTRLNPTDIGALAALGVSSVPVVRRPKVAIISSGDELVAPDEALSPGKIRDVNGVMLNNAVLQEGGEPSFLGIVKDQYPAVKESVIGAIAEYDLVLISGGTSVGVKDALPRVMTELGELLVHGVAAKPGKPTIVGKIQGKPVFGLPGNPVAAFFMFYNFVRPLMHSMQGSQLVDRSVSLPLSRAVPSNHGREEFVPVRMSDGKAEPVASKSGLITTLSCADGFIRIPRDVEGLKQGDIVQVTLLER